MQFIKGTEVATAQEYKQNILPTRTTTISSDALPAAAIKIIRRIIFVDGRLLLVFCGVVVRFLSVGLLERIIY